MTVIFRLLLRWPVGVEVPETAPREGLRLLVERDEEVRVSLIINSIIKLCNWRGDVDSKLFQSLFPSSSVSFIS